MKKLKGWNLKIDKKLALFFAVLLVISVVASVMLVVGGLGSYMDQVSMERVQSGAVDLKEKLDELTNRSEQSAILIAGNKTVVHELQQNNFTGLKSILDAINEKTKLDTISITDAQGDIVIRQHQPDKKGDNILSQTNVQKALQGETQTTIEPGALVKLSCRSGAPIINDAGEIIGAIVVGFVFEKPEFVDNLKTLHGIDFMMFQDDALISSTITQDDERVVDIKIDETAQEALKQGKGYEGIVDVNVQHYMGTYQPLMDHTGNTVGTYFAGLSLAQADAAKSATLLQTVIYIPILIILSLLAMSWYVRLKIQKPIKSVTQAAEKLAAGDTRVAVGTLSKDEIGQMGRAFTAVVDTIKRLSDDLKTMLDHISKGQFSHRADNLAYNGEYSEIIHGINSMTDAFVENFDRIPAPILALDREFNILHINKAGADITEFSREELLGKKCYDVLHAGDCKSEHCACYRAMKNKRREEHETFAQPRADLHLDIRYVGTPVIKDGEVVGVFEVITDLTDIKKAGQEAKEQAATLKNLLEEVNTAAEQVAAGTNQVSDGSQEISQGAIEQASAIEELTASIGDISEQIKQNAVKTGKARELVLSAQQESIAGNERMQDLQQAMQQINESSSSISKIIKVIDDIAFQTNLLALNAAVEAARAGAHGKGFSVVAEEVRNLAAKSAEAAKETAELIETSIKKVENGTGLANNTAKVLTNILDSAVDSARFMEEIAAASSQQAAGIMQINRGIEQVANVIQHNSATAEEAAAAAEELSSQADLLKGMVVRFNRNEVYDGNSL